MNTSRCLCRRSGTCTPWRHSCCQCFKTVHAPVADSSQPTRTVNQKRYGTAQDRMRMPCVVHARCKVQQPAAHSTECISCIHLASRSPGLCSLHAVAIYDGTVELGLAKWLADMLPGCGDRPLCQSAAPPFTASRHSAVPARLSPGRCSGAPRRSSAAPRWSPKSAHNLGTTWVKDCAE